MRPRICCCNPQILWKSPGYEKNKVCSLSRRCQYHNQYWPTIPYAQSGPLTITITTDHLLASNLWSGQRKKVLIHSFCLCVKKHNVIFTISLTGNCGHSAYAKVGSRALDCPFKSISFPLLSCWSLRQLTVLHHRASLCLFSTTKKTGWPTYYSPPSFFVKNNWGQKMWENSRESMVEVLIVLIFLCGIGVCHALFE